jgi:hypothetical protein
LALFNLAAEEVDMAKFRAREAKKKAKEDEKEAKKKAKEAKKAAAASGKDSKAAVNAEAAGKDMPAKVTTVMSTRRRASVKGGVEKTQGTTGSNTPFGSTRSSRGVAPRCAPRSGSRSNQITAQSREKR